jgi:superfamily II DNA/RNA helicase
MHDPVEVNIALSKPAAGILQGAYLVRDSQKIPLVIKLLTGKELSSVLIFVSTKSGVKDLESELRKARLAARAISSDLSQQEREEVLLSFRTRKTLILVATDILSRGIDIDNIGLVINYDVPGDAEDYVHRIGRTARAESTGVALTLVNEKDQHRLAQIETLIEKEVPRIALPPEIGTSPEWNPVKFKKVFAKKKGFKRK